MNCFLRQKVREKAGKRYRGKDWKKRKVASGGEFEVLLISSTIF